MTLLSICQQAANEAGFSAPSTIIGNNDDTAIKLLAAAQTEGRVLARGRSPDGVGIHNWSDLRKEQTFSTASGTASYDLVGGIVTDDDFLRFVNDTFWDRTNNRRLTLFTPEKWQWIKGSLNTNTSIDRAIIQRGKKLFIDPTPASVDTLAFEYVSDEWCESSGGTGQTAWAEDADVPVLDEHLHILGIKWRFLSMKGLPYFEEKEEYEQEVITAMAQDGGAATIGLSRPEIPYGRVPDSGFG